MYVCVGVCVCRPMCVVVYVCGVCECVFGGVCMWLCGVYVVV